MWRSSSAKPGTIALANEYVATVVEIVEPKAMDSGKVTVDAAALAKGLQAEEEVALYGLFFDTGKATIRPESKPQLDEMARVLQANAGRERVHRRPHRTIRARWMRTSRCRRRARRR